MTTKDQRRPGLLADAPNGAAEQQHDSTPSDLEALAALKTLRVWLGTASISTTYDQRPGHLPSDAVSADAFKRRHRELRKAGIAGVWTRGKLLVCTAEAWGHDLPARKRVPKLAVVPDVDELDAALGIRMRGAK